ncbi:YvrJ family protein [Paenibacillus sp. GCM10023252]|uniref:YvrJ family protein n=1 Tax=Paenibacillus sp. GCM10023252 TaxID=3252649 RepID=UPI003623215C
MDSSQTVSFVVTAISQVGFPIVLTGYLLTRFEKKLDILTDTITRLIEVANNRKDEEVNGRRNI